MRKLSKSFNEFLENSGWSANKFLEHAEYLYKRFNGHVEIGRTVVHLYGNGRQLKAYVHHNGRSAEYLTLTDAHGAELTTFHYTDTPEEILYSIHYFLKELVD